MVSTNGTGLKESVKEQRLQKRREARQEAHRARQNNDAILNEFQPDAVEIENRSVPGGTRWTLYAVIGLLISVVAWSCWAEVDQIVTAHGKLITTEPPVLIDTKLASPIRAIHVRFGDRVVAGQELATLDPTFSEADLNRLEGKKKSLIALRSRLDAEQHDVEFTTIDHQHDLNWMMQEQVYLERKNEHEAKQLEFDAELSKLKVQQANNIKEIGFHRENFASYREYEENIRKLADRGSKSFEDVLGRKLQSNDAMMRVQQAESRKLELEKEIESLATRRKAFLATWRSQTVTQLVDAHEKLNEIEQELHKAKQSNTYVSLRVPDTLPYKEYVVFEVADTSVGSIMEPGQPLFRLIPIGVPFEVEIEIPGKDIARIQEASLAQVESGELPRGSAVRVKLDSFPYQKHGTLNGAIRKISEDSFEKDVPAGFPSTMYKARVRLIDPIQMDNVLDTFRLMPGMTSTAEIKVGKRRVIQYFLYPLIRYLDTSIREP